MDRPDASRGADDPVETAFAEFHEALFSGKRPDPEAFCRSHPECGSELRDRIDVFLMVFEHLSGPDVGGDGLLEESGEGNGTSGRMLGDFRILREIGRGGMGVVYEAEQVSLHRRVALKVLPSHLGISKEAVLKFRREAEAGGRQSHPGIVAIHGVGEHEGFHYIAQELIEGSFTMEDQLDALRKEGAPPPGYFRRAAKLLADVADALQHAHESGVIHRDVKPSNILLTKDGRTKVTDFGLAKLEDALALSRTGEFAGTPYYMSPEQIIGSHKTIDRRTDIYSLGVTFYEMLTFRRPFEGDSSYEVLKKIPMVEPLDPQKANPRVPRDLSVVCLKAMEKAPARRYQTMEEFAEDLGRFLSGDVIKAKPAGPATKALKRIKRNPLLSGAVGAALLAVLTLIAWGVLYFVQMKIQYEENLRYSDTDRIYRLQAQVDELWPAYPEKIAALRTWVREADEIVSRIEQHRAALEELRAKERLDEGEQQLLGRLENLMTMTDSLVDAEAGLIMDVKSRLQFAETVYGESIEKHKEEWDRAIASIADPKQCPQYEGLKIDYQIGLVPLGQDPESGLWEFVNTQTGTIPERDNEGYLVVKEETGIVFVLLPAGTVRFDDFEVPLDPFFLSKYEMTQAQWLRITGENPSSYFPGNPRYLAESQFTLRNPVEMVSWNDCNLVLSKLKMVFPTEAQWQYAYRAGTTTTWYSGDDPHSLQGYENLADRGSKEAYGDGYTYEEWMDDGYVEHAPVGSYMANPFGLHDMGGNVIEWVRDGCNEYKSVLFLPADGYQKDIPESVFSRWRGQRGGSCHETAYFARAVRRSFTTPNMRINAGGLRPAMPVR